MHYLALSREHAVAKYAGRRHPESALGRSWHGWRDATAPEWLELPSREELRLWGDDAPLDTSRPRKRHHFDRRAAGGEAADGAPRQLRDAALGVLEEAAASEDGRLLADLSRQAGALVRLRALLAPSGPLPSLRGWAMRPDSLLLLVEEILENRPAVVVELGSGASTAVLGLALERAGGHGRLLSLESEEQHLVRASRRVAALGAERRVQLIHAPLVEIPVGGERYRYYDLRELLERLPGDIDLLVVDGPPGPTGPLARYPALPLLGARLAPGARVFLDDASRSAERSIRARWLVEDTRLEELPVPDTEKGAVLLRCGARPVPRVARARRGVRGWLAALDTLVRVRRSGLFDAGFYLRSNPDVAAARLPALLHYVLHGAAEGRNPSARFDAAAYLRAHPELCGHGENPVVHYLRARSRT